MSFKNIEDKPKNEESHSNNTHSTFKEERQDNLIYSEHQRDENRKLDGSIHRKS